MRLIPTTLALAIVAAPQLAAASSSDWLESEGGRVRIVTTGAVDEAGKLQGALEVDLLPGWKTYWRDPGEAGVPPVIDLSASPGVALEDMRFPAPQRFDDGYSKWVGYKHSVTLPITISFDGGGTSKMIGANVFLGICQTICIPVQGELSVDPDDAADDPGDRAVVEEGLRALPAPASAEFGAAIIGKTDDALLVEATLPSGAQDPDLFVASSSDFLFGTPERQTKDGKLFFSVPVIDKPETILAGVRFDYTLVSGDQAVEGTLALP